jgi:hypothetical protein
MEKPMMQQVWRPVRIRKQNRKRVLLFISQLRKLNGVQTLWKYGKASSLERRSRDATEEKQP